MRFIIALIVMLAATNASADVVCDWVGKSLVCHDYNPPPPPPPPPPDMRDRPAGGGGMPPYRPRAPQINSPWIDQPAGGGGMPLPDED